MDIQKIKKINILLGIFLLIIISISLYYDPLFSNKPLGLDAIGHLSKISYMKEYTFSNWNMVWYGGTPFLKFYSPAFYYSAALFSNSIFGANFVCFLSILLTSLGIFFLVKHISKKIYPALISSILFLSVLSMSYYYISVGNHPYVFALWTIPFSLFFLEKSFENKKFLIPFSLILALSILSHVFIGFCVIFLVFMRFLILEGLNVKSAKQFIFFILPGFFLSCFWFVPFLTHSSQFVGNSIGYIPRLSHLLGFGNYMIWGINPGAIGIAFIFFLFSLFFVKKFIKNKYLIFVLISSLIFFLLMVGILGKFYPSGVGAVRFILPFSIFISIFGGLVIGKIKLKKQYVIFIILILALGLVWNYNVINTNFTKYSYGGDQDRYGFMTNFSQDENFILNKDFYNYRFGTSRYIFSETLNYFFPSQSQTWGYYDQGILYPDIMYLMRDKIWRSTDLNSTLYFLNWFGIKYLEIGGTEDSKFKEKFEKNSDLFREVLNQDFYDYSFTIYEYREATPIISFIKTNIKSVEDIDIKNMAEKNLNPKKIIYVISDKNISIYNNYSVLDFEWKREIPDKIEINFYKAEPGSIVLFKEFYYPSWKAKEFPSEENLEIYRTANNMMLVLPNKGTEKVIFYQSKLFLDYLGIVISLSSLVLLIFIIFKREPEKYMK